MNGQNDRCDRTAYVSGLQPTISDIELFEHFNRVAHVEKVIVRNGTVRHALVVFKNVAGLYKVLIHSQGTHLHGRQLHIRPLRESSHSNIESIANMVDKAKSNGRGGYRRPASVQDHYTPSPASQSPSGCYGGYNNNSNQRGNRNYSENYGRRHSEYRYPSEPFIPAQQNYGYPAYPMENFQIESYAEGARRFDNLANIIRSSTPSDPFANHRKLSDTQRHDPRQRAGSARDHNPAQKTGPPNWKMELQIKKEPHAEEPPRQPMSPQQFLAQVAQAEQVSTGDQKKKRPNLSVINPSLFYDMYPRTSSPVHHGHVRVQADQTVPSPHDPAVLAYSRLKASELAEMSPIDANDCSFVTKHFGVSGDHSLGQGQPARRDMTNEELSDLIVSTGNLRIDPAIREHFDDHEPAPWSPVKRLRAESGCLSNAHQFTSPQFSPIETRTGAFNETEDDVFHSGHAALPAAPKPLEIELLDQKSVESQDINNSRLPSNSHSANPSSCKKEFVFPNYPLCRHSSVPSLAHLVGDLSDGHFGSIDPHVTIDRKLAFNELSSLIQHSTTDGKMIDSQSGQFPLYDNF